ncbi:MULTISPECIES: tetratricopeptide repeat protein [Pseudomonas]|jgi:tetratricopeptide (TPR) repeat protein|uniref:TPR domain-containing protein n=1 Tax=Pseudomonas TaxID=286 RepID=UPI001070883E|nr:MULTISPECIES: tetratricopeptide repeat protein [Pseudomonas]QBR33374.1 tetratricopeptide repeat protein [Pseudomonas sp. S150]UZT91560.1 tetratricopeptide repeat protein [Pseudomonas koreensis]
MSSNEVQEWTLEGVLDELARLDSSMHDRHFAFILGSGASFSSNIPTGKDLAQRWLTDLHLRECRSDENLEDWVKSSGIVSGNLTYETAAEFYPQIFERRFRGDRESGYAELEKHMDGKSPSLGYTLLAEIIQETRHKVVVTTNFDNLVADALSMHAHQSPLVVAHESLVGFVRPQLRRPLVAKIHRDLYFNPINDQDGVSNLEEGWKNALKKLFQYFTPIVVGYGGNDGSLMGLLNSLDLGDIAGRIIWCYREGSPPPPLAQEVLIKHDGIKVKIPGFDEFMLQLAAKLVPDFDLNRIAERTEELGKKSADRYRKQADQLMKALAQGTKEQRNTRKVMAQSVPPRKSWWAWELEASAQNDPEKQNEIYQKGLMQFPDSPELLYNYALFLSNFKGDIPSAEETYKKALALAPYDTDIIYGYAEMLKHHKKDHNAAKELALKIINLDPNNINAICMLASIAAEQGNLIEADNYFRKALKLNPENHDTLAEYADYLSDHRQKYDLADEYYKKSLELAPSDPTTLGNYANFLAFQVKRLDEAKIFFQKALEADPDDLTTKQNYRLFLDTKKKAHPPIKRTAKPTSKNENQK